MATEISYLLNVYLADDRWQFLCWFFESDTYIVLIALIAQMFTSIMAEAV